MPECRKRGRNTCVVSIIGMFKKAIFLFFIAVLIIVLGGVGGVLFDAVVMPRVADMPALSGAEFLKHLNERVTVINKTEQIVMREEDPLEKTVSQPAAAVMTLVTSDGTARLSEAGTGVLVTNDGLFMAYGGVQAEAMAARTYQAVLFAGSVRQAELVGHENIYTAPIQRLGNRRGVHCWQPGWAPDLCDRALRV